MLTRPMFNKFRKYSVVELCRIVPFQCVYKFRLRMERGRVMRQKDWTAVPWRGELDSEAFRAFYDCVRKDGEAAVRRADRILAGEVEVFGEWYAFDPSCNWLTDPVSRCEWPADAFCHTAPVRNAGCRDVKYVLEVGKMNHLVDVAVAYYYTGDLRYTDYLLHALRGWMSQVKPGRSVCCRIMMDLGFRILNLTQILLLVSGKTTSHVRKFTSHLNETTSHLNETASHVDLFTCILSIIREHAVRIRRFSTPRWFKTGNGANHVTGEMIGLLVGEWVLERCAKAKPRAMKEEWRYLVQVLDRTMAPSGAYLEMSSNYARVVADFLLLFDLLQEGFQPSGEGVRRYREGRYTERLFRFLSQLAYHDMLPNHGDNDDARVAVCFRNEGSEVEYLLQAYKRFCGVGKSAAADYKDGSQWIYRSSDGHEVYVFSRIGRFSPFRDGAGTHAHADLLAVILGVGGQMVFVDKGCAFYNQDAAARYADQSTLSHNTVTVDGMEMCTPLAGGGYSQAPVSVCRVDERSDARMRMAGEVQYGAVRHCRTMEYDENVLRLTDVVEVADEAEHACTLHFLLHPEISVSPVSGKNALTLSTRTHRLMLSVEGAENLRLTPITYSPSFARIRPTQALSAAVSFKKRHTIVTTIAIQTI